MDLMYTDAPKLFSDCTVEHMRPLTDHDLVSFSLRISDDSAVAVEEQPPEVPDIMKFNFKQADHKKMAQELSNVDWDQTLGRAGGIEEANDVLVREIVSAAERAQVPRYTDKGKLDDRKLKRLIDERKQLQKKLNKNIADMRLMHKESLKERIKVKNNEIHEFIEAKKKEERKRTP